MLIYIIIIIYKIYIVPCKKITLRRLCDEYHIILFNICYVKMYKTYLNKKCGVVSV